MYRRVSSLFQPSHWPQKDAPRFAPLIDLRVGELLGHLAIAGATPGATQALHPVGLADTRHRAVANEVLMDLESLLRVAALAASQRKLVLPVPVEFLQSDTAIEQLAGFVLALGLAPRDCIVACHAESARRHALALRDRLARAGLGSALLDVGGGHGDLVVWAQLRPDFVCIDPALVAGIDSQAEHREFVRAIVDLGRAVGSQVVALGVTGLEVCRELAALGVDAAGGPFVGEPVPSPRDTGSELGGPQVFTETRVALTAEQLVVDSLPLAPETTVKELVRLIHAEPHRDAFPVVDPAGHPLGMIWKSSFLLLYSKPLHPEVLNRKPVTAVMDTAPLVIDSRLRLEQVSRLVTRKSHRHLTEQFIIARRGVYAGVGHTIDLLHHLTRQEVEVAAHSNPLTGLPGNGPINDETERLLRSGARFVVAHVDLDDFKPFNDAYGYAHGDQVLLHVAQLLREAGAPRSDFIGHLGGDDFVLLLRSPDWQNRLRWAVTEFARSVAGFYSPEHRRAGFLETTDRYGALRRFPLLTLSAAILDVNPAEAALSSARAIAERLTPLKQAAKRTPGHCLLCATANGTHDLLADWRQDADGLGVANL